MYKFKRLNRGLKTPLLEDIADLGEVMKLCVQFRKVLFDDAFCAGFKGFEEQIGEFKSQEACLSFIQAVENLVESAGRSFWIVKCKRDNAFVGFIYLYGIYGSEAQSACVGCCFKREFWGEEVLKIGQKFVKYCFSRFQIYKLKCETMRSNPYVAGFLKNLGFSIEGVLKGETFVGGKAQTLILWGLRAEEWTKKRTHRVLDYTSRSINNKTIVTDFSKPRKKN